MAALHQWLLVIVLSLPLGNSQTDGGLRQCTNISDTSFTINAQPDESYTLFCQKNCSPGAYRWYHAATPNPSDQLIKIEEGPQHDLTVTATPTQSIVGYFCCACSGQYVRGTSCCYGVAYSPQVIILQITQNGKNVTAIHDGESFTLECEVYGYPEVDSVITGPETFREEDYRSTTLENGRWYSIHKTVNIILANESFSGTYRCQGLISFTQGGETVVEKSDDVPENQLVVYKRPTITGLRQEGEADVKITLACDVECSVDYNVSWLHNMEPVVITEGGKYQQYFSDTDSSHKLVVKVTSPSDIGNYTCVVNTVYEVNEANLTLRLSVGQNPEQPEIIVHIGPLQDPGSETSSSLLPKVLVGITVAAALLVTVIAVILYLVRKAAPAVGGAGNRDEEREHLTSGVRESGDDVEKDGTGRGEASVHSNLEKKGLGFGFVPHRRKQKPITL